MRKMEIKRRDITKSNIELNCLNLCFSNQTKGLLTLTIPNKIKELDEKLNTKDVKGSMFGNNIVLLCNNYVLYVFEDNSKLNIVYKSDNKGPNIVYSKRYLAHYYSAIQLFFKKIKLNFGIQDYIYTTEVSSRGHTHCVLYSNENLSKNITKIKSIGKKCLKTDFVKIDLQKVRATNIFYYMFKGYIRYAYSKSLRLELNNILKNNYLGKYDGIKNITQKGYYLQNVSDLLLRKKNNKKEDQEKLEIAIYKFNYDELLNPLNLYKEYNEFYTERLVNLKMFEKKLKHISSDEAKCLKSLLNDKNNLNIKKFILSCVFFYFVLGYTKRVIKRYDCLINLGVFVYSLLTQKNNKRSESEYLKMGLFFHEYFLDLYLFDLLNIEVTSYEGLYNVKVDSVYGKININPKIEVFKLFDKVLMFSNKIKAKTVFVMPPKDWHGGVSADDYSGGGYKNESNIKMSLGKSHHGSSVFFPENGIFIRCINKIQQTSLSLDIIMIEYLLKFKDNIKNTLYSEDTGESNKETFDNILVECVELMVYKKLGYSYSVDFRGRIYPVSDGLNYMSSKLARSLVRFTTKSELTDSILKYFKISLVKLRIGSVDWSYNKIVDYFESILKKEIDDWFMLFENHSEDSINYGISADEPYLFLAHLIEYGRIVNIPKYESNFILGVDASCSGSQIITMLTGYGVHKAELNLIKKDGNDKVGDYYMSIINAFMDHLRNIIKEDSQNYFIVLELNKFSLLQLRKLFKKIIMTMNYGLTYYGTRVKLTEVLESENNIKLLLVDSSVSYQKRFVNVLADVFYKYIRSIPLYAMLAFMGKIGYLYAKVGLILKVGLTTKGVYFVTESENTQSNREILDKKHLKYIIEGDKLLCYTNDSILITYNYYKLQKDELITYFSFSKKRKKRKIIIQTMTDERDGRKESRAIIANFIHSFDAAILYSVLNMYDKELLTIHDSYGVSIGEIERFLGIYRICFGELFKDRKKTLLYFDELVNNLAKYEDEIGIKTISMLRKKLEALCLEDDSVKKHDIMCSSYILNF